MQSTYRVKHLPNQSRNIWLDWLDWLNVGKFKYWHYWLTLKRLGEINFIPNCNFSKNLSSR